jgi:DNA adenine methylase
MAMASTGDLLYCDPPYTVAHNQNGFIKYNEILFSFADQERLAIAAKRAARLGAKVYVSNADHQSIRELYMGSTLEVLGRSSIISSKAAHRRPVTELLIEVRA